MLSIVLCIMYFSEPIPAETEEVDVPHMVFDVEFPTQHEEEGVPDVKGSLLKRQPLQREHIQEACCLAYEESLLLLAKKKNLSVCSRKKCGLPTKILTTTSGSAIYLKWVCSGTNLFTITNLCKMNS